MRSLAVLLVTVKVYSTKRTILRILKPKLKSNFQFQEQPGRQCCLSESERLREPIRF